MHQPPHKKSISLQQPSEDPRLRSKCTTPKRMDQNQQLKYKALYTIVDSNEKTKDKRDRYANGGSKQVDSHEGLDKQLTKRIQSYSVISGTLRQYLRQQMAKDKCKNKLLNTTVQIIKAFAKTQINEVNPHVSDLIHSILDTLPLSKSKTKKRKKSIKENTKTKAKTECNDENEFSFGKEKRWRKEQEKEQNNLRMEIEELQQNLTSLKVQGESLEQIRAQFDSMEEREKREYIEELARIVRRQQEVLDGMEEQY